MQTNKFTKLLASLSQLTVRQRKHLIDIASTTSNHTSVPVELDPVNSRPSKCPHCEGSHFVRFGIVSKLQRYRCRNCLKTFNILTGTPLAHLRHKDHWQSFAQDLTTGVTVRKSAINCMVHRNTSFRWRHRFLKQLADMQPHLLTAITEVDETYYLESMKGQRNLPRKARKRGGKAKKRGLSKEQSCVLVARDREGHTLSKLIAEFTADTLHEILEPQLAKDVLLCTDGISVYKSFANKYEIAHQPLNIKANIRVIDKVLHIQNVNAYDSRLRKWIKKFNGVATCYLPNYLGWFRILDKMKNKIKPSNFILGAMGITYQQLTVT